MTVSTTSNKVTYEGNGSTTAFAIPFYFLDNDDIEVILRNASDTEATWTYGTQFTASGAGEQGGGTLTVVTTPTDYTPKSGEKLLIKRVEQYTQPTDLPVAGAFPSATVEQSLDRLTMLTQQLKETLDRAVLVPETDGAASLVADIDSVRANKLAGWASDGSLTTYDPGAAENHSVFLEPSGGDDTTAIQNAIDAATAQTYGGVVRLSEGLFSVTGLTMKTRVTLEGQGSSTVLTLANGSNTHVIQNNLNSDEHITIRDLFIDANKDNNTGDIDAIHIVLSNSTTDFLNASAYGNVDPRHLYENIRIRRPVRRGIHYYGRGVTQFKSVNVREASEDGFRIESADNELIACIAGGIGGTGYWDGGGNAYIGCNAYFCGQAAGLVGDVTKGNGYYQDWGKHRSRFVACQAQDVWRHGWLIRGEASVFAGCTADAIGSLYPKHGHGSSSTVDTYGIYFESATDNLVTGFSLMDRFAPGGGGGTGGPYAEAVIGFDTNSDRNEIWASAFEGHVTGDLAFFAGTQKNNRVTINGEVVGGFGAAPERIGSLNALTLDDFIPDLTKRNHGTIQIDVAGTISPPTGMQMGFYTLTAFNSSAVANPAALLANFDYVAGKFDKAINGLNHVQIIVSENPSDNSRVTTAICTALTLIDVHTF